jgi:hypothetical protein
MQLETIDGYLNPFKFRYACGDGYLKVYTKGQEEKYHYDKHDYEFCGTATPPVVKTEGPRLVLLFKVRKSSYHILIKF